MKLKIRNVFLSYLLVSSSLGFLLLPTLTLAAVTVTSATGGEAISADTTGGSYTSLTGPIIAESVVGDVGTGTIILNVPTGFEFRTTSNSVTAIRTNIDGENNCHGTGNKVLKIGSSGTSQVVTPTLSTITIDVSQSSDGNTSICRGIVTWSGIAVRPITGTPLVNGNITNSGSSSITGVSNGTTNFGTLTEVAGVASKLAFLGQPASTTAGSIITPAVTIQIQDQFGNLENNSLNVSLAIGTNPSGGILSGGTSTNAVSGTATFSNLQIDKAGNGYTLIASSSGLTSATSNAFNINAVAPVTHTLTYIAGANGIITGTTTQTVNDGESGTAVTAVANSGFHFINWSDASTTNPRIDTNVTANISVTANFTADATTTATTTATHTLTYTAGANGTITGTTTQTVNNGSNGTAVTAVPNSNFHFVDWSDASTTNPRTDRDVTANISVTANFAIDTKTIIVASSTIATSTSAGTVTMEISSSTAVTGPVTWDGVINPPTATTTFTAPTPDSGFISATTIIALEVGAGDMPLTFDKSVKITFGGLAGKFVGWSRGGVFTQITSTCNSSSTPTLAAGADCKIDVGADLVVWTKHFTVFVVYTQTPAPAPTTPAPTVVVGGGNGAPVGLIGGSSGGQVLGASIGPVISQPQGQVLGVTIYNFVNNLTVGSRGTDVTELQKILIALGLLKINAPTGYFGPLTKSAVKGYQKANNISPQSGFVGPKTRGVLNSQSIGTSTSLDNIKLQIQALVTQLAQIQEKIKTITK